MPTIIFNQYNGLWVCGICAVAFLQPINGWWCFLATDFYGESCSDMELNIYFLNSIESCCEPNTKPSCYRFSSPNSYK